MLSQSSLTPSVPSASLLRFLRAQSESALFSTNQPSACRRISTKLPPRSSNLVSLRRPSSRAGYLQLSSCQSRLFSEADPSRSRTSRSDKSLLPSSSSNALQPFPRSQQSRNFSSTRGRSILKRFWDFRRKKPAPENRGPSLLDDTDGGLSLARALAAKASNELRLRCTEFDINGNVTLMNGEFKKSELIAKYGLLPRDLRKIDSSTLPHIFVRPSTILINLLHLRVLIKADRVLVFDAYGSTDSYMQSLFVYDLEGKLRQKQAQAGGTLPYEFRALEAVMISVTTGLEEEFNGVREPVVRVLRALEEDIDRDKLRHLLIYSKKLGTFEQKARLVRDAIDDLLEADDDLASMYLSERANGVHREEHDHQEVEMLLESYHKVCDEIVQASGNLVTSIRNTEEVVKAILDANRNSLMLLDLKFSIGTLGLATGTLFSALYGMNLKNFIEESDLGFGAVSVTCFAISALVCVYGLAKLRKLQRVRMWGEAGVGGTPILPIHSSRNSALPGHRANWRADSIEPVWGSIPGEGRAERMERIKDTSAAAAAARSAASNAASRSASLKRALKFPSESTSTSGSKPASANSKDTATAARSEGSGSA
ncbi:CorA family magnesium transporter [Aspergillus undulatus]|uniref:CorA family magnesium transporter n=1 Tax=Aspergillus undulatus TaxID=1810928 RepID=UPI003CCCEA22